LFDNSNNEEAWEFMSPIVLQRKLSHIKEERTKVEIRRQEEMELNKLRFDNFVRLFTYINNQLIGNKLLIPRHIIKKWKSELCLPC